MSSYSELVSSNSENSSNTENFIAPAMDNIENLCKLMSLELVNILSKQYNFDANEACNFLGIEYSTENHVILEESDSDSEHSVKDNTDECVSSITNSIGQLSVSDTKMERKKKVPIAETETEVEEKKPTKARAKKVANTDDVIAPASTEDTEEKKKPAKARASAKKTKTDVDVAPANTEDPEEKKKPAKARASAKKTKTDEDAHAKNTNSDDGEN